VSRNLRGDISATYANSPTFRRVYDSVHRDRSILQKLTLGQTRISGIRAQTNEDPTSRGAIVVGGQAARDGAGNIIAAIRLTTIIPPGSIGPKAGHEIQHGIEFRIYGSPTKAPDARSSAGGVGVETQTALDVERQIQQELRDSRMRNKLTPEEEANLFDVPEGCVNNPAQCPATKLIIDPGPSTTSRDQR
jgi:hypothetical protein